MSTVWVYSICSGPSVSFLNFLTSFLSVSKMNFESQIDNLLGTVSTKEGKIIQERIPFYY